MWSTDGITTTGESHAPLSKYLCLPPISILICFSQWDTTDVIQIYQALTYWNDRGFLFNCCHVGSGRDQTDRDRQRQRQRDKTERHTYTERVSKHLLKGTTCLHTYQRSKPLDDSGTDACFLLDMKN